MNILKNLLMLMKIMPGKKVKLLVKAKLQGGTNNITDNEGKNLTSIAVLASFCSVDITPSVDFASNLIASHLGTCLSISQDRTKALVCYPSEPLVTEARSEERRVGKECRSMWS